MAEPRFDLPPEPIPSAREERSEVPPDLPRGNSPMARVKRLAATRMSGLFDNATSRRDMRVQLRGVKGPILLGLYLLALTIITLLMYRDMSGYGRDIIDAQTRLGEFYSYVVGLIGALVMLVVPAMAGSAVVLERSRQSLDLLFTAPIRPEEFLWGKLLAIVRFAGIMIALALPVLAVTMLLGGATIFELIGAFLVILMASAVTGSIGLLASALAKKPLQGLIQSYLAAGVYILCTLPFMGLLKVADGILIDPVASFLTQLNPFTAGISATTVSAPFGLAIFPNLILTGLASLALVRFFLAAAAVVLSPGQWKPMRDFRRMVLVLMGAIGVIAATTFPESVQNQAISAGLVVLASGLFLGGTIFGGYLGGHGLDGTRRNRLNGIFDPREAFTGTPSGQLPFATLCLGAAAVGFFGSAALEGYRMVAPPGSQVLGLGIAALYFLVCTLSGRLISSMTLSLQKASAISLATGIFVWGFLAMIGGILSNFDSSRMIAETLFRFHIVQIFNPTFSEAAPAIIFNTLLLGGMAMVMWRLSNRSYQRSLAARERRMKAFGSR